MPGNLKKWWKRLVAAGLMISIFSIGFVVYPREKKVVLTLGVFAGNQWDVPDDDCYKIIDEVIKEFEKENPNVTIQYDSGILKDDYSEWISQKALKGDLPDVFMILPEDFSTFSSIGMLKKLDSLIAEDRTFCKEDYYEESYEAGKYGENQYALPYESVPTLMFVNKTLLRQEGISMPDNQWTWNDFYKICKKVTKDTNGDGRLDQFGVYDYGWEDAVYSNGGDLFNNTGTVCNLSSNNIENAILFVKKIQQLSDFQTLTSDDFDTGKIAFRPMKFSEFRTYKPYPWKINKYFEFQWDCIKLPKGPDGENNAKVDHLMMGIGSHSKNSTLAWKFLKKFTYDTKTQQKLFQDSHGISSLKSVTNSEKAQQILEEDMGKDTIVKMKLLDQVMTEALRTPKFRRYNDVFQHIDSEMQQILLNDEEFDANMLKLKKEADQMLNP